MGVERPGGFDAESGLLIVVNGASGVGKSALLELDTDEATPHQLAAQVIELARNDASSRDPAIPELP